MKIVIDLTSLADNFSGIERFAMSIALELIKRKDIHFILLFKNEIHKEFLQRQENVEYLILRGNNKLIFNQLQLPLALWKLRADYYLFLAFPCPFLFGGKKAISVIHDVSCWDCPGSNKKYMIWYFKILYRKVALGKAPIITVSQFSKNRIVDVLGVSEQRVQVVYNGLSQYLLKVMQGGCQSEEIENKMQQIQKKYMLPDSYLLSLSTLEPRKNLKLLVQAYADLMEQGKINRELVLAGRKGWMVDDLLRDISDEIKSHIHFTGFVENEDLAYVYRRASAFVFPSIYEGFGVPPIEAMSMGTVVISSDAASMPEVLGDAAFFFQNNDKKALAESILKIEHMSKTKQQEIIEKGYQQARKYTWKVSGERMLEILGLSENAARVEEK